jgi:predicted phosphodiesterase
LYRVGGESVWSEWIQFKTAKNFSSPFEFTYFGDAQNQYKHFVTRVFREAYKKSPDSEFWLISGDLVSEPTENQISELFYAGSPFFSYVPLAPVPGNHDRAYRKANGNYIRNQKGNKIRSDSLAAYWRSSFTLPENGISSLQESSYYFDYQGVRFIMMNSNLMLEEQSEWLESTLQQNMNKWSVVSFHHPIYSATSKRDDDRSRNAFMKVFDKYNVDLVLTGHDHAYARSYKLKNGERVEDNENGTVYVVSVSGPKMYSVNARYDEIMAKTGGYSQLFQVIRFEGNRLSYKAYTADGEIYDSFELTKN